MELTLIHRYKDRPAESYVTSGDEAIIGRPKNTPIHLDLSPDLKVSRPHARLYYHLNCWWVQDLHSKHQTLLNGRPITEDTPVAPGDQLQLGDTIIQVKFSTLDTQLPAGFFDKQATVDEIGSSPRLSPDTQTDLLATVVKITSTYKDQAMWQRFIEEIGRLLPQAEHIAIVLVNEDDELLPVAYTPSGFPAHISFTLIGRAIRFRRPVTWARDVALSDSRPATSLFDTTAALCVPMIVRGRSVGAIYLDTTQPDTSFEDRAGLDRLGELANLIAAFIQTPDPTTFASFPSVFISYAAPDRKFVDRLAADLRRRQIRVWFDEQVQIGQLRREVIEADIRSTRALGVVLSPDSVGHQEVLWEIEAAKQAGKPILPLLLRPCELPAAVENIKSLDFETVAYEDGLNQLAKVINQLPQAVTTVSAADQTIRILFLAANPRDQDQLRLMKEHRVITESLRGTKYGDRFDIEFAGAIRPKDLQGQLRRYKPHLVHFSGHGGRKTGRIIVEDDDELGQAVPTDAFKNLFRIFRGNIRCVVLNACLSESQAQAIKEEIECVVGMSAKIEDEAAIAFAEGFYGMLGDGYSIQNAFEAGCNRIGLDNMSGETIPQLLSKNGINPGTIILV